MKKLARGALMSVALTLAFQHVGAAPAGALAAGQGAWAATGTVTGLSAVPANGPYSVSLSGPMLAALAKPSIPPPPPISCSASLTGSGSFDTSPHVEADGSGTFECTAPGVEIHCSVQIHVEFPPLCIIVDGSCTYNVNVPPASASGTVEIHLYLCTVYTAPPTTSTWSVAGPGAVTFIDAT
jgi:hypothetical protein